MSSFLQYLFLLVIRFAFTLRSRYLWNIIYLRLSLFLDHAGPWNLPLAEHPPDR